MATLVGPIGFNDVAGIDFHPNTGVLYAIGRRPPDAAVGPGVTVLLTIDRTTGTGTEVAPLTPDIKACGAELPLGSRCLAVNDIAFRPDGALYASVDAPVGPPDGFILAGIDLMTGAATSVLPVNLEGFGRDLTGAPDSLEFSLDGTFLFGQSLEGGIFSYDPATATVLTFNDFAAFPAPDFAAIDNMPELTFDATGSLFGVVTGAAPHRTQCLDLPCLVTLALPDSFPTGRGEGVVTGILVATEVGPIIDSDTGMLLAGLNGLAALPPAPPTNQPPVADAGLDRVVFVGSPVTLDGSASSDPDNGPAPLTFAWTQTGGPAVTLDGATTANPTFTPPIFGTYVFSLVVNDGADTSAPDSVTITALVPGNQPPIAVAGPDRAVRLGSLVTLEGGGSTDPDNGPLP